MFQNIIPIERYFENAVSYSYLFGLAIQMILTFLWIPLYASDSYCPECMFSWMIEWSICRILGTMDPLELQEILRQRMQARTKYLCAIHVINLFWIQGALGISGTFPKILSRQTLRKLFMIDFSLKSM